MISRDFKRTVTIDTRTLKLRRRGEREHWAQVFGTGADSLARYGDPFAGVYRVGPNTDLLDRRVGRVPLSPDIARIANTDLWRQLRRSDPIWPTRIAGEVLADPGEGVRRDVAAAVNGRIRAVGRTFYLLGAQREAFSMIVPEDALHEGRNEVQLLRGPARRPAAAPG